MLPTSTKTSQRTASNSKNAENPKRPDPKEESAKRQAVEQPNRDDVHEQREPAQEREGVVRKEGASVPKRG